MMTREERLVKQRAYYHQNRDEIRRKYKEYWKSYYAKNKTKQIQKTQLWRKNNPEKFSAQLRNRVIPTGWYQRNRAYWSGKMAEKYTTNSARILLSNGTRIPQAAWPEPLVELKWAELKLKRLCRNQKT